MSTLGNLHGRRLLLGLVSALAVLVGGVVSAPPAMAADRDCSDFANQRAAQLFFLDQGGPRRDPHRLDAEGDGVACESLPCPCHHGQTPLGTGAGAGSTGGRGVTQLKQRARVVKVTDGDTIEVRLLPGGPLRDVRLVGIDTPEVYGGVECGGRAASRSLKRLLPNGTVVRLLSDTSQDRVDRYGRLLRYVHKARTGRDVNRTQVARGWAQVYVYQGNPFHRVRDYRAAQAAARNAGRGIWGAC